MTGMGKRSMWSVTGLGDLDIVNGSDLRVSKNVIG